MHHRTCLLSRARFHVPHPTCAIKCVPFNTSHHTCPSCFSYALYLPHVAPSTKATSSTQPPWWPFNSSPPTPHVGPRSPAKTCSRATTMAQYVCGASVRSLSGSAMLRSWTSVSLSVHESLCHLCGSWTPRPSAGWLLSPRRLCAPQWRF